MRLFGVGESRQKRARVADSNVAPSAERRANARRAEDGAPFMRLAAPPKPPSALLVGYRIKTSLESLLIGHEDWVMSVAWHRTAEDGFDDGEHGHRRTAVGPVRACRRQRRRREANFG